LPDHGQALEDSLVGGPAREPALAGGADGSVRAVRLRARLYGGELFLCGRARGSAFGGKIWLRTLHHGEQAMQAAEKAKPFLIGDSWSYGAGKTFESVNPADGSIAAIIAECGAEDVDAAVKAAEAALRHPGWGGLYAHQRARLLHRFADLIEKNGELLAQLQTQDNGKTIAESRIQSAWAVEVFRYYASLCEVLESEIIPHRGNYFSFALHEPVGVVGAIAPWNSPISLEAQKLAPALAAGNTIVLKSSEITPQVGLVYGRLALEAGLPPGVLNVVTGFGHTTGSALVGHPSVRLVTFTGGTVTGRAIARAAGDRLIPALLELGGKSPNIVFADADVDQAVAGAVFAIFSNAGQSCIAGSRIFVQDSIYDAFATKLVAATKALVVGDPHDARTAVAPVSSFPHRERIEGMIRMGVEEGAKVLCGGRRPARKELAKGAYVEPTILEVPDNAFKIAQEEIFGPVACLIRFRDEDDLVHQANDTVFGLACGIWSTDYRRIMRVARAIQAGTVWANTYKITSVNMPFGGFKSSGIMRECGIEGMKNYMATKSVYLNLAEGPVHWPPRGQT
jgi:betaine-aldehyde dehydrogenase